MVTGIDVTEIGAIKEVGYEDDDDDDDDGDTNDAPG